LVNESVEGKKQEVADGGGGEKSQGSWDADEPRSIKRGEPQSRRRRDGGGGRSHAGTFATAWKGSCVRFEWTREDTSVSTLAGAVMDW